MAFIDAKEKNFKTLMTENKNQYFDIPKYQRDYKWTAEQFEVLWDSIIENLEKNYFLGAVVLKQTEGDSNAVSVIDGQQRLTTLSIFCQVLYESIKEIENAHTHNEYEYIIPALKSIYFVDRANPKARIRFSIDSPLVIECYHDILTDRKYKDNKKFKGLESFYNAWDFFHNELIKYEYNKDLNKLFQIANTILDNLYIISIKVLEEGNERQIFRTINSTGLDLENADIIKSCLIKDGTDNSWNTIFSNRKFWTENFHKQRSSRLEIFFQYYILIKDSKENKEYKTQEKLFDNYVKQIENMNEKQIKKELEDIEYYAVIFENFLSDSSPITPDDDPRLYFCLEVIKVTENYSFLPLLMEACQKQDQNIISIYTDVISKLLIRALICRVSLKTANKMMSSAFINPLIFNKSIPEWKDISRSILEGNWKNTQASKFLRLLEIQLRLDSVSRSNIRDLQLPTLEHIFAQNISDKTLIEKDLEGNENYIQNIGNMVVMNAKVNIAAKNYPFTDKLTKNYLKENKPYENALNDSSHAEGIAKNKQWTFKEIQERNKQILAWVKKYWSLPIDN